MNTNKWSENIQFMNKHLENQSSVRDFLKSWFEMKGNNYFKYSVCVCVYVNYICNICICMYMYNMYIYVNKYTYVKSSF